MSKMSTGEESNLRNWIKMSSEIFGESSAPTRFLKEKAKESKRGEDEPVIANEGQLVAVLSKMYLDESGEETDGNGNDGNQ